MNAKPCPFCGAKINADDIDTLYPSGIGWIDADEGYRHYVSIHEQPLPKDQWCYKIICQEHYGGCGAEIHGDSKEEAVEKWNRRV